MNKLILANHKMYMNYDDMKVYLNKLPSNLDNVIFFPSSIYIPYFKEKNLNIGIQNISLHEKGAYTGEISINQLKGLDVNYVLLGHSEVRKNLNDTNKDIKEKILLCVKNDVVPVLCVGEDYNEYTLNKTKDVIKKEIDKCLNGIVGDKIIIAYEPIWKIGQEEPLNTNELQFVIEFIKSITKKYQFNNIFVLYGGSVDENNIKDILDTNVDGVLIGSASAEINKFIKIIEVTNK